MKYKDDCVVVRILRWALFLFSEMKNRKKREEGTVGGWMEGGRREGCGVG